MISTSLDPGADAGVHAIRRTAIAALVVSVALIAYGSLYPFAFRDTGRVMLGWPRHATRDDVIINFLLYVPVGVCTFFAAPRAMRSWLRLVLTIGGAVALSTAIEAAQAYDAGRYSSLLDVVLNAAGATGGGLAARALRGRWFWASLPGEPGVAGALLVLALWLCWRLAPFVVDLGGATVAPAVDMLLSSWRPERRLIVPMAVTWLAMLHVVAALAGEHRALGRACGLFLFVSAIRVLMTGNAVSLQEVYGLGAAALMWVSGLRQPWVAAGLLGAQLVEHGLSPGGPWDPRPFNWVPFRYLIRGASELAMQILIGQLLAAALFLWLLLRCRVGFAGAIPLALGTSIGIEWGQTGVRGRWPDVTDPVIHVLVAAALMRIDAIERLFDHAADARRRAGDA